MRKNKNDSVDELRDRRKYVIAELIMIQTALFDLRRKDIIEFKSDNRITYYNNNNTLLMVAIDD